MVDASRSNVSAPITSPIRYVFAPILKSLQQHVQCSNSALSLCYCSDKVDLHVKMSYPRGYPRDRAGWREPLASLPQTKSTRRQQRRLFSSKEKTQKWILLRERFLLNISLTPPTPYMETFQSKIEK